MELLYIFNDPYMLTGEFMDKFVRKFIEDNIDIISANNWKQIFTNWYNEAELIWPDTNEFQELLSIFKDANIQVDLDAREDIIVDATYDFIQQAIDDPDYTDEYGNTITDMYLQDKLHSHLGYNLNELKVLFGRAAAENQLERNWSDNGFYLRVNG